LGDFAQSGFYHDFRFHNRRQNRCDNPHSLTVPIGILARGPTTRELIEALSFKFGNFRAVVHKVLFFLRNLMRSSQYHFGTQEVRLFLQIVPRGAIFSPPWKARTEGEIFPFVDYI
jgi:hypothetical protein